MDRLAVCLALAVLALAQTARVTRESPPDYNVEFLDYADVVSERGCSPEWTLVGDQCYRFFNWWLTFDEAQSKCSQFHGGDLATSDSAETNELFLSLIGDRKDQTSQTWMGGYDVKANGKFKWLDGSATSFTDWKPGQPKTNQAGEKYCTVLKNGKWEAKKCTGKVPYICQKTAVDDSNQEWMLMQSGTFYKLYNLMLNFEASTKVCTAQGAKILTIDSQSENDDVVNFLGKQGNDWTAAFDNEYENSPFNFIWVALRQADASAPWLLPDGTTPSFINWAPNQPDGGDGGRKNCAAVFAPGDKYAGQWNNIKCDEPEHKFICEFEFPVTRGQSSHGATCYHEYKDLYECQLWCLRSGNCYAIDWNHSASPWCRCWIHHVPPPEGLSANPKVDHYIRPGLE